MAKGFAIGFLVATLVWGMVFAGHVMGLFDLGFTAPAQVAVADAGAETEADATPQKGLKQNRRRRRRWGSRRRRARDPNRPSSTTSEIAESGDLLNEERPTEFDMAAAGGEEQLSSREIDAAFGQAMPGIRRCLLLLPDGQSGAGRVSFGLRISGAGRPTAVRLRGPSPLTTGEVGACLRQRARAISFPSFDGPDMVASYPITFE